MNNRLPRRTVHAETSIKIVAHSVEKWGSSKFKKYQENSNNSDNYSINFESNYRIL